MIMISKEKYNRRELAITLVRIEEKILINEMFLALAPTSLKMLSLSMEASKTQAMALDPDSKIPPSSMPQVLVLIKVREYTQKLVG